MFHTKNKCYTVEDPNSCEKRVNYIGVQIYVEGIKQKGSRNLLPFGSPREEARIFDSASRWAKRRKPENVHTSGPYARGRILDMN